MMPAVSARAALENYVRQLRKHDPRLWALVALQFATVAGFSASMAFFALYLHGERGVPMARVGLLIMIASLASAPAQALAGEWSDRLGRRPLIITPLAIRGLVFFGMSALILIHAPYLALVAGLLLARVLGAVFLAAADAFLADVTPPADRVEAYSLVRTGGNLGWAAGPAIGGIAAEHSYALLFALTGLSSLAAAAIGWRWLQETRRREAAAHIRRVDVLAVWRHRGFVSLATATFILFLVMGQMIVPLSVYSTEWRGLSKVQFGYLCSTNGLLVVLIQHPISLFLRRFRPAIALIGASFLYAASYLGIARATSLGAFEAAIVVMTLGEVLFVPTAVGLVSRMASQDDRGRFLGAYGLVRIVAWSTAPWLGGQLLDEFSARPFAVWGTVAGLALLAAVVYSTTAPLYGGLIAGNRVPPGASESTMAEATPAGTSGD